MGVRFVDLDRWVEERFRISVAEVFDKHGEPAFRRVERECVAEAVGLVEGVVATGGGVFCSSENRRLIRESGACTVFLDVAWPVIARRLAGTQGRPKFRDARSARALFEQRRPQYLLADIVVNVAAEDSTELVARRIRRLVSESACATSC